MPPHSQRDLGRGDARGVVEEPASPLHQVITRGGNRGHFTLAQVEPAQTVEIYARMIGEHSQRICSARILQGKNVNAVTGGGDGIGDGSGEAALPHRRASGQDRDDARLDPSEGRVEDGEPGR